MRILIVTQYFWPEQFRINELTLGLRDRGHEVTVLTGLPNYPEGDLYPGYGLFSTADDYEGVPVVRVPLVPRGQARGLRLAANYLSFAALASLLGPYHCRRKFDLIFVFAPSPITACLPAIAMRMFQRSPILLWVLDPWPETEAQVRSIAALGYSYGAG